MKVVQKYVSPNYNTRPCPIDAVLLHATADRNTLASVEWCCAPKAKNPNPVSYHAIVDRDATIYALVPIEKRAWHAGVSQFNGRPNVNDFSIGLSFGNDNAGELYTDEQYEAGAFLVAGWMRIYPAITLDRITTHAIVARPLGRKTDPVGFDMPRFLHLVTEAIQG